MIAITPRGHNVRFTVHVQPRAARTEIVGEHGDALKIRVAAPPVDRAANQELIRFLAKRLRVPTTAVHIVAGHNARRKVVEIDDLSTQELLQTLLPEPA